MVVRGHMIGKSAHFVGQAVVGYIDHGVNIGTTDRLIDDAFCFTASETRACAVKHVGISIIAAVL